MSLLDSILRVWPRPATKAAPLANVLPVWEMGTPTYPSRNFENNVRDGYRKNELIYSCITYKANSAAQAKLVVKSKGSLEPLPTHPLQMLIDVPNPFMTAFDFASLTSTFLDCAGRACWEKVRSGAGAPVQLWPLRPDWLHPIRDSQRFISGYQYDVPGLSPKFVDARNILEFKLWDPLDLYAGLAPVTVAGRVGDVDNSATDFIKLTFEHGGVPMGVLSSKQNLTETQVTAIRSRWRQRYGGFKNWSEPAVLDADATYTRAGLTFRELGFEVLDGRSEARICMILNVPPILVGAKVGLDRSTFSNYAEARTAFWQDGQVPRLKRIADELNSDLAVEYGPAIVIEWDYTDVPAMQEDEGAKWIRAAEAYKAGGISLNEYRDVIGFEEVPDGDEVGSGKPQPPPQLQPLAQQQPNTPPVPVGDEQPKAEAHDHDSKALGDAPDAPERRKREQILHDEMQAFFAGEVERIADGLRNAPSD